MRTWVDASSVIGLDRIGKILMLRKLLGRVYVTPEITAEVRAGHMSPALIGAFGKWIVVRPVRGRRSRYRTSGLGAGEASLLLTSTNERVVLDDLPARRIAESEGRDFTGLLGLLRAAVLTKKLPKKQFKSILVRLLENGFHMSGPLYARLVVVGEGEDGDEE